MGIILVTAIGALVGYLIGLIVFAVVIGLIFYYLIFVLLSNILFRCGITFFSDIKNYKLKTMIAMIKNSGFGGVFGYFCIAAIISIVLFFVFKIPMESFWVFIIWNAIITYIIAGILIYRKFGAVYEERVSGLDIGSKSTGNRAGDHVLYNISDIGLRDIAISILSANGIKNVQKLYGDMEIYLMYETEDGKAAVRCKAEKRDVGVDVLYSMKKGMEHFKCDAGIIFSNQYFTQEALAKSRELYIALFDRDFLLGALKREGTLNKLYHK